MIFVLSQNHIQQPSDIVQPHAIFLEHRVYGHFNLTKINLIAYIGLRKFCAYNLMLCTRAYDRSKVIDIIPYKNFKKVILYKLMLCLYCIHLL